jgi:hypothetical protein
MTDLSDGSREFDRLTSTNRTTTVTRYEYIPVKKDRKLKTKRKILQDVKRKRWI